MLKRSLSIVVLTIVMLLQSVAATAGMHQLHLSDHQSESETHPHIQVNIDNCTTENFTGADVAAEHSEHTKTLDLCLDCQCHGSQGALLSLISNPSQAQPEDVLVALPSVYFPPESSPVYRPPIS